MKIILLYISFLFVVSSYVSASVLQFAYTSDTDLQNKIQKNKSLHNIDSLQTYLFNQGYLDVTIVEVDDTLQINLSQQYELQNLIFGSANTIAMSTPVKFRQEKIREQFEILLSHERKIGYQFATIMIDSSMITDNKVDLFCFLNRGPIATIDSLKFEGLTKTKADVLYKYFSLEDTIATPQVLQSIEKQARKIPFVQFVPPIKQEFEQGYASVNLIVPFKEKRNFLFEGGGGYLSDQELFLWNLSLQFQNIFGAGQNISIVSQKKDINNQHLQFVYQQPIFLLGNGVADFGIQTRDYRDKFYEFVLRSGIQSYYKKKINIGFSGQYKSVELEENNLSYRSAQLSISISNKQLVATSLENKLLYHWQFSYGNRKYASDSVSLSPAISSFNESRIEIKNRIVATLKAPISVMLAMKMQSYQTDEKLPPFAELYLVGGAGSIRGFKDEQFSSIRNLILTVEPQYRFESGNLFLFYDAGYMYDRVSSETSEYDETTFYRYGYGGGIAFVSQSNFLKISFGWNKSLNLDNPRISIELKTGL